MELDFLGFVKEMDDELNITIKPAQVGSDMIDFIEALKNKEELIKISIKSRPKGRLPKTWKQLKQYYILIRKLLKRNHILVNADNVDAVDYEMKMRFLKTDKIKLSEGEEEIPVIPRKKKASMESMDYLIKKLIELYGLDKD